MEVSDETVQYDLGRKAEIYAAAGYAHYWTVTEVGVYVHGRPTPNGYADRILRGPGEQVDVPYAPGVTIDVGRLIGS